MARKWKLAAHTIAWPRGEATEVFQMLEEIAGLGHEGVQFMHPVEAMDISRQALARLGV